MKKLLLSIVCAFTLFALSAQVSDDFSSYTVGGGKLAQQAIAQGKDYWTTWSNQPGGAEDGVIAEQPAGNKAVYLTYGNDQILKLGKKNSGTWIHSFKIYVPANKDAYFNIQADFTGSQTGVWALECYLATLKPTSTTPQPLTPGIGNFYAGKATTTPFNFTHDTWIPMKLIINLDDDEGKFYVNDVLVHEWQYSLGNNGAGGCPKVIDAFNIFPPSNTARSTFYVDDIVFAGETGTTILYETGFDDQTGYVAQKYPQWWQTWSNKPGTTEDALISNEQSVSPTNSAKCVYTGTASNPTGTDLVFKTGAPTTGTYKVDFKMYIPNGVPAYFNLLNNFVPASPNDCQWAIGVYFNIKSGDPNFPAAGTYLQQNNIITNFTVPSNTWFPVSMLVNLDDDIAKISINGNELLTWQFSIDETGASAPKKLAAVDFYPPQTTSIFYIDDFVFTSFSGVDKFPIMDVTPKEITVQTAPGGTVNKTLTVENTGTAIGEYTSWIEFDFTPIPGTTSYTLQHGNGATNPEGVGYPITDNMQIELGAKFSGAKLCDKIGTYIKKLAYYLPSDQQGSPVNKLTFRIYAPDKSNAPGEVLVEIVKNSGVVFDAYNEVTLTTPLLIDKNELWISVEFTHYVGGFNVAVDQGVGVEGVNFTRRNGGAWQPFNQYVDFGNFLVKAVAEGTPVPACWLNLTGNTYGSVPKGTSKTYNAVFNAVGLALGTYKANIKVKTNDTNHPLFTIPCKLIVGNGPNFEVDPTSLNVTTFKENITKQVKISNIGNESGTYKAVVEGSSATWLTLAGDFDSSLAAGGNKTFDAIFNPTGLAAGTYTTTIKITTNSPFTPTITIPCEFIIGKPELTVTPTSIEKEIKNLNTITQEIKISNSGIAEGTYEATVEIASGEWLTITGNTEGKVPANGSANFNAVINPKELENGTYNAKIKIATNDPDHQLFEILCTINVNLGIVENVIHTLVFPNPANDNVTIQSNYNINTIQMVNYMGQIVYSSEVNNNQTTINTSNLASGIYFIKVNTDAGAQSVKLIIK